MGRFRVGDYAILAFPSKRPELKGEEVIILEDEQLTTPKGGKEDLFYYIEVGSTKECFFAKDKQLKPLDDTNTPSSWGQSLWRPKETVE